MSTSYQHWKVITDEEGITWLHIDKADSSANVLSAEVLNELEQELNKLNRKPPRALVFLSDKKNGFFAGADVNEFTQLETEHVALTLIQRGQQIMNMIERLPCPTVALIHGFCLGGGFELALACQYRIADDAATTKIGLPEIKLGIHPGFGGTVRSIKLAGPITAMNLMLSGRTVSARAAKKMGLIHYAVPKRHLLSAARNIIKTSPPKFRIAWWSQLANKKLLRPLVKKLLIKQVSKKAQRAHYPAPYALIDLWECYADDEQRWMEEEAISISQLMLTKTARNLVRVFSLQEKMKSYSQVKDYTPTNIHVIGGGVMGGDIAAWCALQGFRVTIQDREHQTLARVLKRAYSLYKKKLKKRVLVTEAMDRLIPDMQGHGLKQADVVIEAIFEDAEVKRQLFKKIEPLIKDDCILATNTSSIPLEELTPALKNPSRFVGLHFFNPVAKMPLVEIVRGKETSKETMHRAASITKSIRRLPLPVSSSPGFLVNRILMPYLMEAVELVEEGIPLKAIDQAATDFGMPMGPIELADTIGLEICLKVAENLSQGMDIRVPGRLRNLVDKNHLGKKTNKGFYNYKNAKPIKPALAKNFTAPSDLADRLILRLLNEAVACLRDGVVDSNDMVDAGVIFGTGFAPFRGGPICYASTRGIEQLIKLLENLDGRYGDRFKADEGWNALLGTQ
ncbi:enoyl-CoA hydratase/isomerase family protein [Beggiatoa alba]|nr:enoyl-CoA hydratase/isomerase family protein [Beggiatoa alba]